MIRLICSASSLLVLTILTPRADAIPVITLSSPDDLTQLTVGDTARFDVTLQGISTDESIFILNSRVLFPSLAFQPIPDPNNSSGLTPGTILSPVLGTVSQVARFNELSSLAAGVATGNFQDFPNSVAIDDNGLYYSFTMEAIDVGGGIVQFDPTASQFFSNQSLPPNTLVPLPTGGPLAFTITAATVPEPSTLMMATLGLLVSLVYRRRAAGRSGS